MRRNAIRPLVGARPPGEREEEARPRPIAANFTASPRGLAPSMARSAAASTNGAPGPGAGGADAVSVRASCVGGAVVRARLRDPGRRAACARRLRIHGRARIRRALPRAASPGQWRFLDPGAFAFRLDDAPQHPDQDLGVGAEARMRIAMPPPDEALQRLGKLGAGGSSAPSTRIDDARIT
jgi:hypothetical protein